MGDPNIERLENELAAVRAELASMTTDRDMWQELTAQMGDGWAEVRDVIGVQPGETYLPAAQRLRAERDIT